MQQNDTIVVTVRETPSKQPDGLVAPSESLDLMEQIVPLLSTNYPPLPRMYPLGCSPLPPLGKREREREREREARYTRDCFFFLLEADRITDPTH